jgi:valyl-tRNA synthetase
MITLYPMSDPRFVDDASEASMALVQKVVVAVRGLRTDNNVHSSVRCQLVLSVTDDYKKTILEGYRALIADQAKAADIQIRRGGEPLTQRAATAVAGEVEVALLLEGLGGDVEAERAKLSKEAEKLRADRDFFAKKLGNPQFVARARPEAIEKDKARMAEAEAALARLEAALARLG